MNTDNMTKHVRHVNTSGPSQLSTILSRVGLLHLLSYIRHGII